MQSLPGVPGQGRHPEPSLQPPERQRGGRGFIAQVDPWVQATQGKRASLRHLWQGALCDEGALDGQPGAVVPLEGLVVVQEGCQGQAGSFQAALISAFFR